MKTILAHHLSHPNHLNHSNHLRRLGHLNPLSSEQDMSAAAFVLKKSLAFALIYWGSAVLGEGIIIGLLSAMGYDPLHGVMPAGMLADLLPYYGFVIFALAGIAYCRFVEKRSAASIGLSGNAADYLIGALLAVILLFIIVCVHVLCGSLTFSGVHKTENIAGLLLWVPAFAIQGAAEEILCRGFLLQSLRGKVSLPAAIGISSTAFALPHLPSLLEAEFGFAVAGIINLYLISIIFSALVLWRSSLWMACGLHSMWNYVLYIMMGLSLSGSESLREGIFLFRLNGATILNGGAYGLEASIITTAALGIAAAAVVKLWKGRT